MSQPSPDAPEPSTEHPAPRIALRAALGGVLMGLANLVPGVSGGTMLLAAGVYEAFVSAVADVSTLRIRLRPVLVLGTIAGSAALAILLLAGPTKELVVAHRWIMYSLFIGLTLGGVPLVWRMARPVDATVVAGAVTGLIVMILMALGEGSAGSGDHGPFRLVVGGVAGASAMVLPGISGGYLLLLLGLYVPVLSAIDLLKESLSTSGGIDWVLLREALTAVVPFGVGVVLGVVGVSNLVRWLLVHLRQATLGALIGLLLGAVVGLWPFQQGVPPEIGDVVKGSVVSAERVAEIEPDDWPVVRFTPTASQVGTSLGLILLGLLATLAIDRLGSTRNEADRSAP